METPDFVPKTSIFVVSLLSPSYRLRIMLSVPGEVKKESFGTIVESKIAYMKQQGLRIW